MDRTKLDPWWTLFKRAVGANVRLAVLFLLALGAGACGYGGLQEREEQARVAWNEIEVQLQRRVQLAPRMIETIQGYGSVEDEVLAGVTAARASLLGAIREREPAAIERSSVQLSAALRRLLEQPGRYPGLQSDPSFQLLSLQLAETEQEVERARVRYNEAVVRYNEYIGRFPAVIPAKVIGASRLEAFLPAAADSADSATDEAGG